jgi:hypothetical protein
VIRDKQGAEHVVRVEPLLNSLRRSVVNVDGEGRIRMRSETYPVEPNTPSLYARSISATH